MKLLATLLLIGATSVPAYAGGPAIRGQRSVRYENYCYKNVEIYEPGYYNKYGQWVGGYVKHRRKRVPCRNNHRHHNHVPKIPSNTRHEEEYPNMGRVDDNSCIEGTVAGGLLGGALGGVLSKKDNWIWAIPSGMVAGSMIGCQVDGG